MFDYEKMLDYILKMFQLDGIAKDSHAPKVQIAITLDGVDLSRNITHVSARIKIIDPRAIDPRSGLPIGMEGSITKVQSRGELCFVLKIVLAKDNKNLYNTMFNDLFSGSGPFQLTDLVSTRTDLVSLLLRTNRPSGSP